MLRLTIFLLLVGCISPCHAQYFDTLHIHYDIGVAGLQKKYKALLDSIAQLQGGRKMLIYSYADYLGSERRNQHLSENRAMEVKDYLLKKGIAPEQIMECSGLGQVPGSGGSGGDAISRRTDIFIRRAIPLTISVVEDPEPAKYAAALENSFPASGVTDIPHSVTTAGMGTSVNIKDSIANQTPRVANFHFLRGQSEVQPCCNRTLEELYHTMRTNQRVRIRLEGHVCCSIYPDGYVKGTPNWELSVARARSIYQYLTSRGIAPERVEYVGYGHTRPIHDKEIDELHGRINIRVELLVLEK